jgi:hypothetical protein
MYPNAIGYAKYRSRSHDAVIRVYDRAHDEAFSVPLRINNEMFRPSKSMLAIQPQLQSTSLRLSAMIFQYFTGLALSDYSEPFAVRAFSIRAVRSLSGALQ